MLSTIAIVISSLVVINFILLFFSCNKTTIGTVEKVEKKSTRVIHTETTKESASAQLAPTGS